MAATAYRDAEDAGWRAASAEESAPAPQPAESGEGVSWWPLALSETLKRDKPLGVSLGDRRIVLWRDAQGEPQAMIDQCAHRRVPLSMGRVTPDGMLQCGYHGWCFEGGTGRVRRIPNLLDQQRFPPIYRAQSYAAHETGGFIRVCLNKDAPPPPPSPERLPLHGTTTVALGHEHYVAMLFDDPSRLINIPGVRITEYLDSDLGLTAGVVSLDRHCARRWSLKPDRERSRFPFLLRVQADLTTGETTVRLLNDRSREVSRIDLAPTPGARGTTSVNWRATAGRPSPVRLGRSTPAIKVRTDLDAASIAGADPVVSVQFETKMQAKS